MEFKYIDELREYMKKTGDSQSALCKKIGVSTAALSGYLNHTYKAPESLNTKIEEFLKRKETQEEVRVLSGLEEISVFKKTGIAREVMNTISFCHLQRKMGVIYGDAGIGKTMAVSAYADKNSEAVTVTVSPVFNTKRAFLKLLSRKLRVPEGGRIDDTYMSVVDKLTGSEKVIIIDEAQNLPLTTLELVRSLHDDAKVGIVLVGNHEVYAKLTGKGEAAFAQLFSRIGFRKYLLTTNISRSDISLIFGNLPDKVTDCLYRIAESKWGLRGAVMVYSNASLNEDTSPDGIKGMARAMGIGAI